MELTEQAKTILEARYLLRDEDGQVVETPDQLIRRVATAVAKAEMPYLPSISPMIGLVPIINEFEEVMANLEFLPNSPCLANAGRPNGQLSACFVLPVEDSLDSIFDSVKNAALIHKTGGGTGFSFSRLRPKDSLVKSTGQVASGPVSFMKVFDAATQAIKQGGMRRGANMGVLRVDHPDIMEFINCKRAGGVIENFNISVAITDNFMQDLLDCGSGVHMPNYDSQRHCAHEIWEAICRAAWESGDPGLWFVDRVNAGKGNPVPDLGPIESCNPCGEQELYPYDVCTLGSINLSKFVINPGEMTIQPETGRMLRQGINWLRLAMVVRIAVRFLDDVIDVNQYPLPEIEKMAKSIRRIGLGVMGWHDMLLKLGIPYDSNEALGLAEQVMGFIQHEADHASGQLAEEKGGFPKWRDSIWQTRSGAGVRNSVLTTIAPTGTISLIAGCSSGIEPVFSFSYQHHGLEGKLEGKEIVHPLYKVARRDLTHFDRSLWKSAQEIAPEWHVKMQAAFQRYTDNAVSKTINLPHNATVEDVDKAYRLAWELGCKGITIYRDGSKDGQVLTTTESRGEEESDSRHVDSELVGSADTPSSGETQTLRPAILHSMTIKQPTPFGHAYVTISETEPGKPFELFVTIGKAGSDVQAMSEALGRVISYVFRTSKDPVRSAFIIADQLAGIGGSLSAGMGEQKVRSVPEAVSKALEAYLRESYPPMIVISDKPITVKSQHMLCPECGAFSVVKQEGCEVCEAGCGYSRC